MRRSLVAAPDDDLAALGVVVLGAGRDGLGVVEPPEFVVLDDLDAPVAGISLLGSSLPGEFSLTGAIGAAGSYTLVWEGASRTLRRRLRIGEDLEPRAYEPDVATAARIGSADEVEVAQLVEASDLLDSYVERTLVPVREKREYHEDLGHLLLAARIEDPEDGQLATELFEGAQVEGWWGVVYDQGYLDPPMRVTVAVATLADALARAGLGALRPRRVTMKKARDRYEQIAVSAGRIYTGIEAVDDTIRWLLRKSRSRVYLV
jgi:hypothetical protein